MNEVLLETLVEKVNTNEKNINDQEKEIHEMKEMLMALPDHKELFDQVNNRLFELLDQVKKIDFLKNEMRELSSVILSTGEGLKKPAKREVFHHHHVPKIIFSLVGLFIILCLVLAGWYMTGEKLEQYRANDTKYRYLKIYENKSLRELLFLTDSLYLREPRMRDSVLERERQIDKYLEMMKRAAEMEAEANELRKKVN